MPNNPELGTERPIVTVYILENWQKSAKNFPQTTQKMLTKVEQKHAQNLSQTPKTRGFRYASRIARRIALCICTDKQTDKQTDRVVT